MPIMTCQRDGKPGYKYGDDGHCYTYGTNEEQHQARAKAAEQGRAIEAAKRQQDGCGKAHESKP